MTAGAAGLSKLNSMQRRAREAARGRPGPVDVLGRRLEPSTALDGLGATGASDGAPVLELPRKEVIQPQLPLRLPCYDFTPVTSPTFDGSLP